MPPPTHVFFDIGGVLVDWDPRHLYRNVFDSEDEMVDYLSFWMKDGTPREIARALGDVARARGITEVSLEGRTGTQELCPALSRDGNPKLDLVTAVLKVRNSLADRLPRAGPASSMNMMSEQSGR